MARVFLLPWMTIGNTPTGSPDDAGEKFPGTFSWGGSSGGFSDPGSAIPASTVYGYSLMPRPSSGVVYKVTGGPGGVQFIHQKGANPNIWGFTAGPTGVTFSFNGTPQGIVPYGSGGSFQVVSLDVRIGALYARSPSEFYFGYYLYGTSGVEAEAWASNVFRGLWTNGSAFKSFVELMLTGKYSSPEAAAIATGAASYVVVPRSSPYFEAKWNGTSLAGFLQPDGTNYLFEGAGSSLGASTIEGEATAGRITILQRPGDVTPTGALAVSTPGGTPAPTPQDFDMVGLGLLAGGLLLLAALLSSGSRRRA